MVTIYQGETFPIWIALRMNGEILSPDMIEDIKVCFAGISKKLSEEGVSYDEEKRKWKVVPTQKETIGMAPGFHDLSVHLKYEDGRILVRNIQKVCIKESCCKELW